MRTVDVIDLLKELDPNMQREVRLIVWVPGETREDRHPVTGMVIGGFIGHGGHVVLKTS